MKRNIILINYNLNDNWTYDHEFKYLNKKTYVA
jgi:hypothetical protein